MGVKIKNSSTKESNNLHDYESESEDDMDLTSFSKTKWLAS